MQIYMKFLAVVLFLVFGLHVSNKNNKMSYFNTSDPYRGDLNFRQIQKVPS